jgi:hypothetical protein
MIAQNLAETGKCTFPADLLDDLVQCAAVDARLGGGRRHGVAWLRMCSSQRGHGFFRQSRIDPDLGRKIGHVDASAHLAQNSIENAHIGLRHWLVLSGVSMNESD